jgi:hypothetical protein
MARHDKLQGVRYQLGVLERLHVIDKHRELHIARQVATATLLTRFPNEYGFREEWVAGRTLESNMNVLRWTFHAAPPPALVQAKVGAYTGVFSEVSIREGSEFFTLVPHLQAITNRVEVVLERFAHRFD